MPSQIIQSYFNDKNIPLEYRQQTFEDLSSGVVSEDTLETKIKETYLSQQPMVTQTLGTVGQAMEEASPSEMGPVTQQTVDTVGQAIESKKSGKLDNTVGIYRSGGPLHETVDYFSPKQPTEAQKPWEPSDFVAEKAEGFAEKVTDSPLGQKVIAGVTEKALQPVSIPADVIYKTDEMLYSGWDQVKEGVSKLGEGKDAGGGFVDVIKGVGKMVYAPLYGLGSEVVEATEGGLTIEKSLQEMLGIDLLPELSPSDIQKMGPALVGQTVKLPGEAAYRFVKNTHKWQGIDVDTEEWEETYGEPIRMVGDIVTTGTLLSKGGDAFTQKTLKTIENAFNKAVGALDDLAVKFDTKIDKMLYKPPVSKVVDGQLKIEMTPEVQKIMDEGYKKAVGYPKTKYFQDNLSNLGKVKQSYQKTFLNIVKNKENLVYKNADGITYDSGRLPQNAYETSQAIQQIQDDALNGWKALAKESGDDLSVNFDEVIEELKKIADDPVMKTEYPRVAEYAKNKAASFEKQGAYSIDSAQKSVKQSNIGYKPNAKYDASVKTIDQMIGNIMRDNLNDEMATVSGTQYADYKLDWGAAQEIKPFINKVALKEASQTGTPLMDYTNISSGAQAMEAIVSGNPVPLVKGATQFAIKKWMQSSSNPSNIINKMFKKLDKAVYTPQINQALGLDIVDDSFTGGTPGGGTPTTGGTPGGSPSAGVADDVVTPAEEGFAEASKLKSQVNLEKRIATVEKLLDKAVSQHKTAKVVSDLQLELNFLKTQLKKYTNLTK